MAKSKVMRIDKDIARKIKEVQKKKRVSSMLASKMVFYGFKPNTRGKPRMKFSEFLKTSADDFEIHIVHKPKKKV